MPRKQSEQPPEIGLEVLLPALVRVALGHRSPADLDILQGFLTQLEGTNAD